MDATHSARSLLATLDALGVKAPPRLVTTVAVVDAFTSWQADEPMNDLLAALPTLDPADVPATLETIADRLARTSAAKDVLQGALPGANRQVALALQTYGADVIVSLRKPYLAAVERLERIAALLPTDDPADAVAAGDDAVKALRELPKVVATLDAIRSARATVDQRLAVTDLTDPALLVKGDLYTARAHWDDRGPGGKWLAWARLGLEFWLPTPAEVREERLAEQTRAEQEAEAARQAEIHAPGGLADAWARYAPSTPAA